MNVIHKSDDEYQYSLSLTNLTNLAKNKYKSYYGKYDNLSKNLSDIIIYLKNKKKLKNEQSRLEDIIDNAIEHRKIICSPSEAEDLTVLFDCLIRSLDKRISKDAKIYKTS